jgi:hypothetical protein
MLSSAEIRRGGRGRWVLRPPLLLLLGCSLVGKQVKIDGTVFPAGDTYLIVVDSLQVNRENH